MFAFYNYVKKCTFSLLLLFGVYGFPLESNAHDLGITEVMMTETEAGDYVISVEIAENMAYAISPPNIPKRCHFFPSASDQRLGDTLNFQFSCDSSLSNQDELKFRWQRPAVLFSSAWLSGKKTKRLFVKDGDQIVIPLAMLSANQAPISQRAKNYIYLGVTHILAGIDHLFFVLCLVLLIQNFKTLIQTITAFTIGHSLTLSLAYLNLVRLNIPPIEACIALSIVFMAREVFAKQKGEDSLFTQFPWLIAGGFGLLHGFGFASALSDIYVDNTDKSTALLFFNLGVELGQVIFIIALLLTMKIFDKFIFLSTTKLKIINQFPLTNASQHANSLSWQLQYKYLTAYLVGGAATYWTIQRSIPIFTF